MLLLKHQELLRVLKDKIPKAVQPLCINLLGSGIEEQKSLESSVVNILSTQDQWSDSKAKKEVETRKSIRYMN